MCGRYTLSTPGDVLAEIFETPPTPELAPRFNIAPTQEVAAVRLRSGSAERERVLLRWGLIPSWADDPGIGNRLINARSETVAEKPSFRSAFKRQRCLVLADGYYEWQKQADGTKQPFYFRLSGGEAFAFAGLWERWRRDEEEIGSCTLLTTAPNALAATVHDRMPVILPTEAYALWLDPKVQDRARLEALLVAFPAERMEALPVSRYVNNPLHEGPRCLAPIDREP
jgi:putative SOS response-associated peptidase YedK